MSTFVTKWFTRYARREGISASDLCEAIERATAGLIDADLGGGLIKQRIARRNEGRSGGFRAIVAFRLGVHSFFVYGFAKSEKDNISQVDLRALRILAAELLSYGSDELGRAAAAGELDAVDWDA